MGYPTGYWPPGYWPLGYLPIAVDEPQPGDEEGGGDGWTPAPLLDLPTSPEAVAWAAFARLVRESPELRGVETTFRTWDGNPDDDKTPDSIAKPWLRFSPTGTREDSSWGLHKTLVKIDVHIEAIVPGTSFADSANAFAAIRATFSTPAARRSLREAGSARVVVETPAFGEKPHIPRYEPNFPGAITAIGSVEIWVERPR